MDMSTGIHPYARLGNMEALEGARILERKLEVIANNLANIDTIGFKSQRITFKEHLLAQQDGTKRTAKGETGWADFSLGRVHITGNPYDFAIDGEGFFVVQTPGGKMFTRAGNFTINSQYQLVTQEGYPVLGDGVPITLEDTTGNDVWLSEDRNFFVDETITARLDVVTFVDPQKLKRIGRNYFKATKDSGNGMPSESLVKQGYIEDSNVNAMEEMVRMIDLYRGYEAQQKALQACDQLDSKAANELGKVG
jgi:flagellar basal-body rod protein FlgG